MSRIDRTAPAFVPLTANADTRTPGRAEALTKQLNTALARVENENGPREWAPRARAERVLAAVPPPVGPADPAYAWGSGLTGAVRRQFDRPLTAAEGAVLVGALPDVAITARLWLRRLEVADPEAYASMLYLLKGLAPEVRVATLQRIAAQDEGRSAEADLSLATAVERHADAYLHGGTLRGAAQERFDRPITDAEGAIIRSTVPETALAAHLWLRRLEAADPQVYQSTLARLGALTSDERIATLNRISSQCRGGSPAADLRLAATLGFD